MALKDFSDDEGVLIMREEKEDVTTKTEQDDEGNEYEWTFYFELGEDETEWYALTESAADGQVDYQNQPGSSSDYDIAEWEMSLDDKVIGSYTLTRRRRFKRLTRYTKELISEGSG